MRWFTLLTWMLLLVVDAPVSRAAAVSPGQRLAPPELAEFDFFGNGVAVDGSWMVVGAPFDDDLGELSGSVYVFRRIAGVWTLDEKLLADDGEQFDQFGEQVAISGDTVLVSARRPVLGDNDSPGSAYVFRRGPGGWAQEMKLRSDEAVDQDRFGSSVAIQGDRAVVGAVQDDGNLGAAYVFERTGTQWSQVQKLFASKRSAGSFFGESASIDGDTIAIGASGDVEGGTPFAGVVYVFVLEQGVWVEEDDLIASDTRDAIRFGTALSLDGNRLLIGAPFHSETLDTRGAAYVFERSGGSWSETARLVPAATNRSDIAGRGVALRGKSLAIGAPTNPNLVDPHEPGAVYLYEEIGGSWLFRQRILATDSAVNDFFGATVAIGGGTLLVGAIGNDVRGDDAGAAYAFEILASEEVPFLPLWGLGSMAILMALVGAALSRRAGVAR